MTKPKEGKIKEMWEKRFERLIIKQLFLAWEAGKKQVKMPYKYTLDTDKLGRPIFDMAISQRTQLLKEIKEKVEGMKKNRTFMDEDCEWCGKKFCESCKGRNVHNKALSDVLELLTK